MEKQQWLHTLSPLRFPEIPEAVPKEGKQAGSICAHHWGRVCRSVVIIINNNIAVATSQSTCPVGRRWRVSGA